MLLEKIQIQEIPTTALTFIECLHWEFQYDV